MPTTSPEPPWFGLQVRSGAEHLASAALQGKGYRPFLPVYKVARRWSDRVRQVDVPLFPGYMFCRFDPQQRLPILVTPGVMSVVGYGRIPAPIEEQEIQAIQAVVNAGLPAEPWPFTRQGDKVAILRGPLRGLQGIVLRRKKDQRLILSVSLLQRSVAVEIDPAWARRIP